MKFDFIIRPFILVLVLVTQTRAQFRNYINNLASNTVNFLTTGNLETNRNVQQDSSFSSDSNNCGSFFSYRTGIFGFRTTSGLIEIPQPDLKKSEVRAVLTVTSKLSVKF